MTSPKCKNAKNIPSLEYFLSRVQNCEQEHVWSIIWEDSRKKNNQIKTIKAQYSSSISIRSIVVFASTIGMGYNLLLHQSVGVRMVGDHKIRDSGCEMGAFGGMGWDGMANCLVPYFGLTSKRLKKKKLPRVYWISSPERLELHICLSIFFLIVHQRLMKKLEGMGSWEVGRCIEWEHLLLQQRFKDSSHSATNHSMLACSTFNSYW